MVKDWDRREGGTRTAGDRLRALNALSRLLVFYSDDTALCELPRERSVKLVVPHQDRFLTHSNNWILSVYGAKNWICELDRDTAELVTSIVIDNTRELPQIFEQEKMPLIDHLIDELLIEAQQFQEKPFLKTIATLQDVSGHENLSLPYEERFQINKWFVDQVADSFVRKRVADELVNWVKDVRTVHIKSQSREESAVYAEGKNKTLYIVLNIKVGKVINLVAERSLNSRTNEIVHAAPFTGLFETERLLRYDNILNEVLETVSVYGKKV
jgi:hypothetical protein